MADATTAASAYYNWAHPSQPPAAVAAAAASRNGNKESDDDSTLFGCRIVSEQSLDYSSVASNGSIIDDASSLASSLFHGDSYFQHGAPPPGPKVMAPTPVSPATSNFKHYNEERARQFAKALLKKSTNHSNMRSGTTKKQSLWQRAIRSVHRRNNRILTAINTNTPYSSGLIKDRSSSHDEEAIAFNYSEEDDSSLTSYYPQHSPWEDEQDNNGNNTTTKVIEHVPIHAASSSLEEISDCTSEASDFEVWERSSETTSDEEVDDLSFELPPPPLSTSHHRGRRAMDLYCPEGLFVRTTAQEVITKLQLGDKGQSALECLNQARTAAAAGAAAGGGGRVLDSSTSTGTSRLDVVPTLITIAGYAVPDYSTYVQQHVTHFCKTVLKMSDELYELLERRMAKRSSHLDAVVKLNLLPFAVELYCLERLYCNNVHGEEASK